jgi:pimeloyl-ACP methyl ester carboxylesterase
MQRSYNARHHARSNASPAFLFVVELVKLAGIAVAALALLLAGCQEKLIFYPQPAGAPPRKPPSGTLEQVRLSAADGTQLVGWLARPSAGPAPLVIYFGGNAEEVSWMAGESHRFAGWSVLAMNYRGYGDSGGEPGEKALFGDALAIFDYAQSRGDVEHKRIVAMGRSLGSGVAVHLAAHKPVAGVVLAAPYESLEAVAARAYPFLPVRWLLRHRFDSLTLAPAIRAPLLVVAAERDSIIPPEHARRLHDAWAGSRQWVLLKGSGHNDIDDYPEYWNSVAKFLSNL